jgi:hypothetical protein
LSDQRRQQMRKSTLAPQELRKNFIGTGLDEIRDLRKNFVGM